MPGFVRFRHDQHAPRVSQEILRTLRGRRRQTTPCARRIGSRMRSALTNTSRSSSRPAASRLAPRSCTQSSMRSRCRLPAGGRARRDRTACTALRCPARSWPRRSGGRGFRCGQVGGGDAVEAHGLRRRLGAGPQCGLGQIQAHQDADQLGGIVAPALHVRQREQVADAPRSRCHRLGDRSVEAAVQRGMAGRHLRLERHVLGPDVERQPDIHQRRVARRRAHAPRAADEDVMAQRAIQAHVLHQLAQQRDRRTAASPRAAPA